VVQPQRSGHILGMSAFPDLIRRPDPQASRGLVIQPSAVIEPFSSFGLAGLKNVDGLGEMAGTPGAAA
jgi:hypothetical protein